SRCCAEVAHIFMSGRVGDLAEFPAIIVCIGYYLTSPSFPCRIEFPGGTLGCTRGLGWHLSPARRLLETNPVGSDYSANDSSLSVAHPPRKRRLLYSDWRSGLKHVATAASPAIVPARRIRILIALDDPGLHARLSILLHAGNYAVEEANSRQKVQDSVRNTAFDLIILGVKRHEFEHVIEVCRQVRTSAPRSGIVLVSLGDSSDDAAGDRRADGLEAGADDYITAAVESREFLARIRAVLRRIHLAGSPRQIVRSGDLEMDIDRRHVQQNGS